MRAVFILLCALGALNSAYFAQPYARDNPDAILILVTVLTVFAGFLVAVITILGDPAMIPEGSWRAAEIRRSNVEDRLITHTWLFVLYLITIGMMFVGVLIQKSDNSDYIKIWIERIYLFFGIFSFLLTFSLPWMLLKLQMARFEAEIMRRRKVSSIKDTESDK